MITKIISKTKALACYLKAWLKWATNYFGKNKLPPGNLGNLYSREVKEQTYLLKQFQKHGPIVKTRMAEFLTICVVGLERCRRLLKQHGDILPSVTFELQPIIPHGYLRGMEGEVHKKYRSILMRGIAPDAMQQNHELYLGIVEKETESYRQLSDPSSEDYIQSLDRIAHFIMLHIFFGARPGSEYHTTVTNLYAKLWDPLWHYYTNDDQIAAYQELRDTLFANADELSDTADMEGSIMGRIRSADALDETILANMIFMVETGRLAVYSLMRWSVKYAVDNPEPFTHIANDPNSLTNDQLCPALAFVQESLRLNQIERQLRHVRETFVFEGIRFPKGSITRLCLWESHKDEKLFPNPFKFNPQRFIERKFTLDEFAPFGVGSHRCPVGSLSMQICRLYLYYLSSHYKLEGLENGPPYRDVNHYQPAKAFRVILNAR